MDGVAIAAVIVASGAFIASTLTGVAAVIAALTARQTTSKTLVTLGEAAEVQKATHEAVNSNYSRLQNLLLGAVAIIAGLIAYTFVNLRTLAKSPPTNEANPG